MSGALEVMLAICLIVLALVTVQTGKLRRAAVYLGAFSLICSFAYIYYNAPDVAIAEAVIGCTLSTIFFLIAMKKYHVITIYYVEHDPEIQKERRELTASLERFLIDRGFEPQTITTDLDDHELCENACFNLLVVHEKSDINIYSSGIRSISHEIEEYVEHHKPEHLRVSFHCLREGAEGDMQDDEP